MFDSCADICDGFKEHLLLNDRGSKTTLEQYFPKVRDTLIQYPLDGYKGKENLYCIDDFLKEVTVSDIAKSAVIDIQRVDNVKGSVAQATLNNYIIAFRQFFDYLTNLGVENTRIMVFFSRNPKRNDGMRNLRKKTEDELKC